jgi:hypothetical protein
MSRRLCIIQSCPVVQYDDLRVEFTADGDIDADGSPHAYAPGDKGLDLLVNARDRSGRYVGILTDSQGRPLVQSSEDPAPGFYISTTTYEHIERPEATQRRYVDSETVPFIVVSPLLRQTANGIVLGCRARVTNTLNGKVVDAVVADIGPRYRIGELSIAAAKALGISADPRRGGEARRVVKYELWPGEAAVVAGVGYRLVRM